MTPPMTRQRHRLGEERGDDARPREAERAQRADLARAVGDRGVHRVHRAEHRADRQDRGDEGREHADQRAGRRRLPLVVVALADTA